MGLTPQRRSGRQRGTQRTGTRPQPEGLPARLAALSILDGVLNQGRSLDALWDESSKTGSIATLSAEDGTFARALVSTTLRRLGQIDFALSAFMDRPLGQNAARARTLLRLGAAQLLYLRTPAHAAVASTVELAARDRRCQPYKGLTNAVLRKIAGESEALRERAARQPALPLWLLERWRTAYGAPAATALASAHLTEPALDLTVKPGDETAWAGRLDAVLLPTGSLRLPKGTPVAGRPGYQEGAWWVQDAAAALPARLLPVRPGMAVLDLCAAPGGKTLQLAAAGAQVTALDRSAQRLERLKENLHRTGLQADLVTADALDWAPAGPQQAILLDAPCSATGTIRRHPDIAHIKTAEDITALAGLQSRLLDRALGWLAPGGVLVYCVCSLEPEEGPAQIEAALARHPALRRAAITAADLPGIEAFLTAAGDVRTLPSHWPERGGLDGFYIARLQPPA